MSEPSRTLTSTPRIAVIVGATRQHRVGRKVADAVAALVSGIHDAQVEALDLAEVALPFFDEPNPPAQGRYTMETTKAWAARIAGYDGFVIVTPEYNGGYPGVLKNALDTVWGEWNGKPFQIVAYGFHGGASASDQLRTVIGRLRGQVVEPVVNIVIGVDERDDAGDIRDASSVVGAHREHISRAFEALLDQARSA